MSSTTDVFSKRPNDAAGHALLEAMKKYLNKGRYELVKKGQGLMDCVDWRRYTHGQPISKSTHLRIYIKEKR